MGQKKDRAKKKPYGKRSDVEKIQANWKKTLGLFNRGEFSVAVVRAAVTLELAVTFAIRQELIVQRKIDSEFVDHLLLWANGINGKFKQILLPIHKGNNRHKAIIGLFKKTKLVNDQRNSVAHRGEFKNKKTAVIVIRDSHAIITELVSFYESSFKIDDIE